MGSLKIGKETNGSKTWLVEETKPVKKNTDTLVVECSMKFS